MFEAAAWLFAPAIVLPCVTSYRGIDHSGESYSDDGAVGAAVPGGLLGCRLIRIRGSSAMPNVVQRQVNPREIRKTLWKLRDGKPW